MRDERLVLQVVGIRHVLQQRDRLTVVADHDRRAVGAHHQAAERLVVDVPVVRMGLDRVAVTERIVEVIIAR